MRKISIKEVFKKYNTLEKFKKNEKYLKKSGALGNNGDQMSSMIKKVLEKGDEEILRAVRLGHLSVYQAYDKVLPESRKDKIPHRARRRLEQCIHNLILDLCETTQKKPLDEREYWLIAIHFARMIVDFYYQNLISEVAMFRSLVIIKKRLNNTVTGYVQKEIRSKYTIPLVDEDTFFLWEGNPDFYYPKVLRENKLH